MTVLITLTTAGADSGPFDLYTNLDGYVSAFATGVSKSALLAGYSSSSVPDFATIIRVKSTGDCVNYIDITLVGTTTTTTTTAAPTTTTTTTASPYVYWGTYRKDDPCGVDTNVYQLTTNSFFYYLDGGIYYLADPYSWFEYDRYEAPDYIYILQVFFGSSTYSGGEQGSTCPPTVPE